MERIGKGKKADHPQPAIRAASIERLRNSPAPYEKAERQERGHDVGHQLAGTGAEEADHDHGPYQQKAGHAVVTQHPFYRHNARRPEKEQCPWHEQKRQCLEKKPRGLLMGLVLPIPVNRDKCSLT